MINRLLLASIYKMYVEKCSARFELVKRATNFHYISKVFDFMNFCVELKIYNTRMKSSNLPELSLNEIHHAVKSYLKTVSPNKKYSN